LARLENWQLGQAYLSPQEPLPTSTTASSNRLIGRVSLEFEKIRTHGHTPRLEQLVQLLHLSYTYHEASGDKQARNQRAQQLAREIFALGSNDLEAPTESDRPLAYFISYPRSGNTLATRLTARATQGQTFSALNGGTVPFSKKIYPKSYPYPRLIKDHVPHSHYRHDPCVLIVRDGRDTMVSLAYMTLQSGHHSFKRKGELGDFIRWTAKNYAYGSWAGNTRDLLALTKAGRKLLIRYEDLSSNEETFLSILNFFDPENCVPREQLHTLFENRDSILDRLKNNRIANRSWGLGHVFEPESLFFEWSRARGKSTWRDSWDDDAKRAFHETGATELLMELGYEADKDWWKS